ncbi:MAG: isoprenylcysteine carboxylmethyltransferase family protein [Desulfobacterium sp.]|nr:isoprenylcysteine carboxylmethyltransferase family protein [Desulfobacterium sp.]MBU3947294.1 isoprenylcysteine carboxylmethyltransferase family protein [Pseudomonadota bacterium]MBU4036700.1 isoprenylcysteine carboxylmethyltransferase family protein [Pseudomonadota bacterium]
MPLLKDIFREMDFERLILVPIFVFLLLANATMVYNYAKLHDFSSVTILFSLLHKVLVVCFCLLVIALFFIRSQARATSRSWIARIIAYAGSFTPFLLIFTKNSSEHSTTYTVLTALSIVIMTGGILFSLYSLISLGKSFGIIPQARGLVRSGPYHFIRHPLYVGEIIAFGGTILSGFTMLKFCIFLLLVVIQSYRALEEEKVLEETFPEYSAYMAQTSRFIPGFI